MYVILKNLPIYSKSYLRLFCILYISNCYFYTRDIKKQNKGLPYLNFV